MATLSDTPTPTSLTTTSEAGGVSIKIEQGVLQENNDDYEGSGFNIERRGIQNMKYESNHPSDMENVSNSLMEDNFNMYSIPHSIFQPDVQIKVEPPVDIDDSHPDEEAEENTNQHLQSPNGSLQNNIPKIRLTPTSKLIATPNGSTDNKRRYVCPYENCTKSYGKSSHLRSHLTWHTGIKPFVCKEPGCGKGFTRSDELNRHIRTHTGEKPFECVQCTKKFSRSDHLTKHLATHSKQQSASNRGLAKKMKLDKNLTQETVIPAAALVPVEINSPNMSVSNNKNNSINVAKAPNNLETAQVDCIKIKKENSEISEDYKIVLPKQELNNLATSPTPIKQQLEINIKTEPEAVIKPEPTDDETIKMSYENEPDDNAIMPEANLPPLPQNTLIIPLSTVNSPTPALVKSNLNQVADSVYDPTRPYPCSHCTKNFKRQDDLNRHMRTHTGEKPFACNECDKRFMRSDHLKKHMNTHTRVR